MSQNRHKYQVLATLLEQLQADATTTQLDAPELRQRLAELQEFFRQEIVSLTDADSRVQSFRTEISKQLRLLEVDVMFLQGARQASTAKARLQTISSRLTTLIQYCAAILQQEENGEK
ncbi:heterocyst frequency control protein PatD [Cylindrospermum sp. FACHB-282]|uniref:heterocyst frequency control protein PatD n=1 Tax=Cylindrospermum sp. FACHB-282 TaxID=2692794 RepID=UPI0016857A25|nr:heterocyst frequency control protein PatD [Cylindrospermum sp. FACHB-282]MBD2386939.1 heterocyst frequency control protein PatD [Cylindrospermum sp. FACHB-282]